MRRSVIWATTVASCAALVAASGCVSGEAGDPSDATRSTAGKGATAGAGAGGLTGNGGTGGSAGSGVTTGGTGGSAVGGAGGSVVAGSGGTVAGSGGVSGTGGASSGGVGNTSGVGAVSGAGGTSGGAAGSGGTGGGMNGGMSGGGAGGEPCVDVEPPPDPEWPGATCDNWANETTECSADWFKDYCDVSCGRCTPTGGGGSGGTGGATAVDCSGEGLPNVTGGDGYATRYWDCCQTHCSQFNGHRCGQDGVSSTGSTQSACSGGGSFACYDEAPRAVSDCLSYGHIAKSNPNCGGCYRIQFTGEGQHNANDPGSKLIKGKQMIVKVTNTGGDVGGNQFDLMIPGGGVGMFNACSNQWGTNDLGAQYGGFLTECTGSHAQKKECVRAECMKIPAGRAREGCLWFVDWFEVADNPKFTSQSTNCEF
jgi:hypothetical protein